MIRRCNPNPGPHDAVRPTHCSKIVRTRQCVSVEIIKGNALPGFKKMLIIRVFI